MFDLRKLFVREMRARKGQGLDPDSDYHPSDRQGDGLEVEYQSLIATQFRRLGIATGCVTVEVRKLGRAPDGYDVFVGMVRLETWERESALRMLLGLPLLESKVRKAVRGTWLADYSHFGGLWLHSAEQLHSMPGARELRDLLLQLAPPAAPSSTTPGTAEPYAIYATSSLSRDSDAANEGPGSSAAPSSAILPG